MSNFICEKCLCQWRDRAVELAESTICMIDSLLESGGITLTGGAFRAIDEDTRHNLEWRFRDDNTLDLWGCNEILTATGVWDAEKKHKVQALRKLIVEMHTAGSRDGRRAGKSKVHGARRPMATEEEQDLLSPDHERHWFEHASEEEYQAAGDDVYVFDRDAEDAESP
jgi:hypothetical protein